MCENTFANSWYRFLYPIKYTGAPNTIQVNVCNHYIHLNLLEHFVNIMMCHRVMLNWICVTSRQYCKCDARTLIAVWSICSLNHIDLFLHIVCAADVSLWVYLLNVHAKWTSLLTCNTLNSIYYKIIIVKISLWLKYVLFIITFRS